MITFEWTFFQTLTLLSLVISCHLMAWLTEMRGAPAEPTCYVAAEFALELYEVCTMFITVLLARTHANCGTKSTD
jgi:hypothetical protein